MDRSIASGLLTATCGIIVYIQELHKAARDFFLMLLDQMPMPFLFPTFSVDCSSCSFNTTYLHQNTNSTTRLPVASLLKNRFSAVLLTTNRTQLDKFPFILTNTVYIIIITNMACSSLMLLTHMHDHQRLWLVCARQRLQSASTSSIQGNFFKNVCFGNAMIRHFVVVPYDIHPLVLCRL